ncbi:glycosyltransferase family A protein [Catenuloplanes sp. NPDC051500]|uniref:glycosyltransferase family A protein n=1 Tax=Catenuloplanes sp. NPDC051500 TaxID=3363959 RepID=UPI0037B0DC50
MVTRDRPLLADRAIRCFAAQTHPARELVIVSQGGREYVARLRASLQAHGVHDAVLVTADPDLRLGELRNLSVDAAAGDLLCIWDDDDLSHPDRLTAQIAGLHERRCHTSFLSEHLQLFADSGELHWIDWHRPPEAAYPLLPATMLTTRDPAFRYPEHGRYAHLGEDWAMLIELHRQVPVHHLAGQPQLYVYTYHGRNVFSGDHHGRMRIRSRPRGDLLADEPRIRDAVAALGLHPPITVTGCDGDAFTIEHTG